MSSQSLWFRKSAPSTAGREGVSAAQAGKAGEVAVSAQEFAHSVLERQSRDVRIVSQVSSRLPTEDGVLQVEEMHGAFTQEHQRARVEEGFQVRDCVAEIGRWIENAGMSDDPQEFVHAGPWQSPRRRAFGELTQQRDGLPVVRGLGSPRVYEDVGIDPDQERPSIRSRSASRSSSRTPGMSRPRSVFQCSRYPVRLRRG